MVAMGMAKKPIRGADRAVKVIQDQLMERAAAPSKRLSKAIRKEARMIKKEMKAKLMPKVSPIQRFTEFLSIMIGSSERYWQSLRKIGQPGAQKGAFRLAAFRRTIPLIRLTSLCAKVDSYTDDIKASTAILREVYAAHLMQVGRKRHQKHILTQEHGEYWWLHPETEAGSEGELKTQTVNTAPVPRFRLPLDLPSGPITPSKLKTKRRLEMVSRIRTWERHFGQLVAIQPDEKGNNVMKKVWELSTYPHKYIEHCIESVLGAERLKIELGMSKVENAVDQLENIFNTTMGSISHNAVLAAKRARLAGNEVKAEAMQKRADKAKMFRIPRPDEDVKVRGLGNASVLVPCSWRKIETERRAFLVGRSDRSSMENGSVQRPAESNSDESSTELAPFSDRRLYKVARERLREDRAREVPPDPRVGPKAWQ